MIPIARPFIGEEEKKAVVEVLDSGIIAQGPKVEEFEKKFAEFCGVNNAVAVNSGTASLHTALHVMGIGRGDEVITTPLTFIATGNCILMQGAKPVFADIKPDTFNIDPECIKEKITGNTKAIITVDFYGQLCDYDKINKIAKENDLLIVEDSCQAVGAEYNGKKAGSFGDIGAFSFYATKNITGGEGGALVTDNEEYANKARLFRQHGMSNLEAYDYNDIGYNYRMTDINAAILIEQLKKIKEFTERRIKNAEYLNKKLQNIKGIEVPFIKKGFKHVYHLYTIKIVNFKISRDELFKYLRERGIGGNIYYPKPLHLCENFKKFGYKEGDFPIAEKISKQILSLPVHPSLTEEELEKISQAIIVV